MPSRHHLPSGLTVLVEENPSAPVVAVQVWMGVGGADEEPDEAGLAHLHEHMLFKGTARRGPGAVARDIESCGGEINAWTSFDQTVYHIVLASRFVAEGLDVLGDLITSSAFDPDELRREIEVVCEEIRRAADSPARRLSRDLFEAAFPHHPYGKPVLGTEASVRSFTREGIVRFYRRWYQPWNCTVVIAGDVRAEQVLPLVEKSFVFPEVTAPRQRRSRPTEALRHEPVVRVRREELKDAYLSLAWPTPPLLHDDVPALDAASMLLGSGEAARLPRALKRDRLLCSEVHASCYTPGDPGLSIVGLTLQPEQIRDAVREALAQVYRLRSDTAAPDEVERACKVLESEAVYQRETVQGMARKIGFYETGAGGLEYEERYLEQLSTLGRAELQAAVRRHFDPRAPVLCVLLPKDAPADLDEAAFHALLEEARAGAEARPAPPRSGARAPARERIHVHGRARTGEILREEIPGGGTLILKEERAVPLVAMRAVWTGGQRAETAATAGASVLLARLASKATRTRGAEQIAREMEAMGGGLSGSPGRNSFGLRAEVLSRHLEQGFDLFAEALTEPAFPAAEVDRERTLQLQELRSRDDNPASAAFLLFAETLYRRHPYRFDQLGTLASVGDFTPASLEQERARLYPARDVTLAVVGDVDPAAMRALVHRRLGRAGVGSKAGQAAAPIGEDPVTAPRAAVRSLAKAQAHLVLGFPGVRLTDDLRFPLEVLSSVLSGQGGRLFLELRDKKSLAYSVSSYSVEGIDPGYFAVYIGCGPNKVEEALTGIREQLDRLRQEAPSEAELDRARSDLIGSQAIGLQRCAARASVYALDEAYGLGCDASLRMPDRVAAVTAEDVLRAARQILDPSREIVALVAPETSVPAALRDAAARAKAAQR